MLKTTKIRYFCATCGVQYIVDVPASVETSRVEVFAARELRRNGWKVPLPRRALCAVHALRERQ